MNSKPEETYFQFPIRALRVNCRLDMVTREQASNIFDDAMSYSIAQLASEILSDADERYTGMASKYLARHPSSESEEESDSVLALAAACEVLKVHVTAPLSEKMVESYRYTWERIERVPGSNLLVRVRRDLMWHFRNEWDFRDAVILCGVYAGVGNETYRKLTCDRIRTLAMGFASVAELKRHGPRLRTLTDRQVRHTLGRLERRGLFQCATPDGRHKYYSHRLSEQELIGALAQHVAKRERRKIDTKRAAILAQAQALMAADAAAAMQSGGR